MAGDFGRHNAFMHIVHIRKTEMFCRSHIAEKIGAAGCRKSPANGGGNVVIARCYIGNNGPQHIQRRPMGQLLGHFHIHAHIRNRHMARAFHHDLHTSPAGTEHQLTQVNQFGNLDGIGGIMAAAAAAAVS